MKDLTDEEYDALDEYYTENMPKVDFTKNGSYAKKTPNVVIVDEFSGKWLLIKALETQKSTAEIINEMIQKEIAASN
jgi:hypothetical protein